MIGVIADDVTGATDVAAAFRREGLRTVLAFGVPSGRAELPHGDVVVIALKTRTAPAHEAVECSLRAVEWLRRRGAAQFYVKYCSTFDSTPQGNIGPVLDAVSHALGVSSVITTPSSPEHGRTQYQGYLFVGGSLLSDSPMRDHPLTPMTDSSLVRLLTAQSAEKAAVIPLAAVRAGHDAIRRAARRAERSGARYLLVDAVDRDDLRTVGRVVRGHRLVAGASGLAGGLAAAVVRASTTRHRDGDHASAATIAGGRAVALAGSCSARTRQQVALLRRRGHPAYRLDPLATGDPETLASRALDWYASVPAWPAPVIYSSLDPRRMRRVQEALGILESAALIERTIGRIAVGLVASGVARLVVAGGETGGAVVSALGAPGGRIGPEAAVGVPWILVRTEPALALLLKSGNFGAPDLLATAVAPLPREAMSA